MLAVAAAGMGDDTSERQDVSHVPPTRDAKEPNPGMAGVRAESHVFIAVELFPLLPRAAAGDLHGEVPPPPAHPKPVTISALVDTGATRSVISSALAARLQAPLLPWGGRVRSASGSTMSPIGVVALPARPKGVRRDPDIFTFLVVDSLIHAIVIGMDMLRLLGARLDLSKPSVDQLELGGTAVATARGIAGSAAAGDDLVIAALTTALGAAPEDSPPPLPDGPDYREAGPSIDSLRNATQHWPELFDIFLRFRHVFATEGRAPGTTSKVMHHVPTDRAAPVRRAPYRLGAERERIARAEIEALETRGLIRRSTSPWAAPIVLIPKPDGSTRLCVDYRALNKLTVKDSFPLPRIENLFDHMQGARFFTTFDLASGYHQVPMAPSDVAKTAFVTPWGLYEWLVMPFGLCNAPATFQRLMQDVLHGLDGFVGIYIDDVVIFSRTPEEHLRHVAAVLERLEQANLHLKFKKCRFGQSQIKYLGHIVDARGLSVDRAKVAAMAEMPQPRNVQEIQAFLGAANYYRRFVPGFSSIAEPLHNLTRKGVPFVWTPECERAWRTLRNALAQAPVLALPDPDAQFVLQTDASLVGLGAVLCQRIDGVEYVLSYLSRSLSKAERNYSATEREALAVIWAITTWDPYLHGRHFVVETDHQALKWLLSVREPTQRLARWVTTLQQYDFEVVYRPGRSNGNADALSRLPLKETDTTAADAVVAAAAAAAAVDTDADDFAHKQRRDVYLAPLIKFLQDKTLPPEPAVSRRVVACAPFYGFDERDRLIILPNDSKQRRQASARVVVPESLKARVLADNHDAPAAGHQGRLRTLQRIADRFYWDGMARDVEHYVTTCVECQQRKRRPNRPGSMQPIIENDPHATVALDYMGPVRPTSRNGNKYVLVVTDLFTKFAQFIPTKANDAATTAHHLVRDVIGRFGAPRRILTDRGTHFTAQVVRATAVLLGARQTFTTPYHPQGDGQTERLNQSLQDMVSKYIKDQHRDWDRFLPILALAYNSAKHASTGDTPFFLTFGRDPYSPADVGLHIDVGPQASWSTADDYRAALVTSLQDAHNAARACLDRARSTQVRQYDARHTPTEYKPGDQVWLYVPRVARGTSKKIARLWTGPFRVLERTGPVTYRLSGSGNRRLHQLVNVARLKRYHERSARPSSAPTELPEDDTFDPALDAEAMPSDELASREPRTLVDQDLAPPSVVGDESSSDAEDADVSGSDSEAEQDEVNTAARNPLPGRVGARTPFPPLFPPVLPASADDSDSDNSADELLRY